MMHFAFFRGKDFIIAYVSDGFKNIEVFDAVICGLYRGFIFAFRFKKMFLSFSS